MAERVRFEKRSDFGFGFLKCAINIVIKRSFEFSFIETIEQNCIFQKIKNLIIDMVDIAILVDLIWEIGSVEIEGEPLEFSDCLFEIFSGEL